MSREELLDKYKGQRVKVEVWTRVMGYMRPVSSFNVGKRSEHRQRIFFQTQESMQRHA